MKDEYVMGIDNGGTVTKAAIYDRKGQVLAIASKSTQMLTPREFHTERSIDELWAANVEVIKKAIEQSGIDASQIKGVAVTGHGNGLYLVDEEGHPVRNGIISTDSRAKEYVERWQRSPEFLTDILPKNDAVHLGRTTCRPAGMAEGFRARDAAKSALYFYGQGPDPFLPDGRGFS